MMLDHMLRFIILIVSLHLPTVLAVAAHLSLRDNCNTQTVVSGDTCASLAQKCGISGDDFTKYNNPSPCASLAPGQQVCCSSGTLPSRKPSQNSDGSCHAYTVQSGDSCSQIAASFDLKLSDLSTFNDKTTWAWSGCDNLMAQTAICLSTGTPPLPPSVDNAICGPTKPGTRLQPGTALADLSPCPLNACCDVWGQCGTTPEFCTAAEVGPTGNPGTAPPGQNGCISNCGIYFANMRTPAKQINVGYYESWNFDRKCLNMKADDIDTSLYTHYHWAFVNVNDDFTLSVNDSAGQWERFKSLTGIKRIVSIGGWGFSTELKTYDILRKAMTGDNNKKFAANIVWFLNAHGLDGIDIDWEYPGAPDNQGVATLPPTGLSTDGSNYWTLLYNLRHMLPAGGDKSISIAAPSSYWYLKAFPIGAIQDQVDYIVYMTYDLQGQWSYGNKWSIAGCPAGDCLRSHVNMTETVYALSMITKAGVSTDKLVIGISSYGRSFGMTDSACVGPLCTFKGPESGATPGECTGVAGYLANAEINKLIAQGGFGWRSWYDSSSMSDILVYGNAQWVAYMSDSTRQQRRDIYKAYNFAGTADWAVDLLQFLGDDGDTGAADDYYSYDDESGCDYTLRFNTLDDLEAASGDYEPDCLRIYALQTLITMLDAAWNNYTSVNDGYDEEFGYYVTYMRNLVPAVLDNDFMFNTQLAHDDGTLPHAGDGFTYFDCENDKHPKSACVPDGDDAGLGKSAADPMLLWLRDIDGYKDALAKKGILPEWIVWGDYNFEGFWYFDTHKQSRTYKFSNFPVRNESMVVANPKDLITKALGSISNLKLDMSATLAEMKMGVWVGDENGGTVDDPVQVYSIPVFMLMQAIENMAQAKALGHKEEEAEAKAEEERKKNLILLIISIFLIFVPVVGEEAAAAAGLADVARGIAIAGELGNAALGIYDTVNDPASAFLNIIGMLFGAGAILKASRDAPGLAGVAKIRKGMTADQISGLGSVFGAQDAKLQSVLKVCKLD